MKGMPPAWAATPSTHASPTMTMWGASGQRRRTTRRPSGSGLSAVTSSRVTTRSTWRSRSKRARTKSATTRSLLVQMAVAKPSCLIAVSASIAKGSRIACSMARRACVWGMASTSASRCGASALTKANSSGPDQRSSRRGRGRPRSRTKASISRPTALRSSGELTSVWSRLKTQTGRLCVTASAAVRRQAVGLAEEVAEQLDAGPVQRPVGHDQLDVLRQGVANARGGLLGTHDGAGSLEHAVQRPAVVRGSEHRRDVHEPRRLDGAKQVLSAPRRGADEADGRSLGQLGQPQQRLDAGLGQQRDRGRSVRRQNALDLMDVEEGRDHGSVTLEEAGIACGLRLELVHEHPVHLEWQLRLELVAVARQLRVVALDEHGPAARDLGRAASRRARGQRGQEFVLGEAEPAHALETLADQALEAPRRAPLARGAVGHEGAAPLLALDITVPLEVGQCAGYRVRIDPEEARQLAHRRQLHARLERARGNQMADLGHELHVHGHGALPVDLKSRRRRYA